VARTGRLAGVAGAALLYDTAQECARPRDDLASDSSLASHIYASPELPCCFHAGNQLTLNHSIVLGHASSKANTGSYFKSL
jgi:hypothetical protein